MNKVYVVTAGCFDEYRIEAVFTDEQAAHKYKEFMDKAEGMDDRSVYWYYADIPLTEYVIYGAYSYSRDMILYKRVAAQFDVYNWNIRRGDQFLFVVQYDEKYDDAAVLLQTVRALADGAAGG